MSKLKVPDKYDRSSEGDRPLKQARVHLNPSIILPVDRRIAERLDNLRTGNNTRPKFIPNRPRIKTNMNQKERLDTCKVDRLNLKYETLVTEFDRSRPTVKMVNITSALESLKLGEDQAKKQMDLQVKLGQLGGIKRTSVSRKFKFNDGYEMPSSKFPPTSDCSLSQQNSDNSIDTTPDLPTYSHRPMSEMFKARKARMALRVEQVNQRLEDNEPLSCVKKDSAANKKMSVRFAEPLTSSDQSQSQCDENEESDTSLDTFYKYLYPDSDEEVSDTDNRLD